MYIWLNLGSIKNMKNKQIVIGPATLEFLRRLAAIGEYAQERIDMGRCPKGDVAMARTHGAADQMFNLYEAFEKDKINPLVGLI